ncbi:MAG: tyrosine-type recombinase/integrase [Vicinamibacterales bacterium]
MGVYRRQDSPFWWITLPRRGARQVAFSTGIPVVGTTPAQTRDNRRLAEQIHQAQLGDIARRRFGLPPASPPPTFAAHATWYLEHHVPRHRGARRETWALHRLIAAFGALRLDEIRPARWQEYVTARSRDVTISTIGRELAILKAVLMTAVGEHLEASPLATVKRPSVRLPAKRTLTRAEVMPLAAALEAEDPELRDLFLVGLGTLLRQETLLNLHAREVRPDRLVVRTKTGPHQIPLAGPSPLQRLARRILRRRRQTAPDGYVFHRWHARFAAHADTAHPRVQLLRHVRRAVEAVGLPWGLGHGGVVWHTMTRASGATLMLRTYQVDIRTVQLVGGWSSLDQMSGYLGMDRTALGLRLEP